ncbi:hypothetical protein ACB098_06G075100 [Castanea mollissima]
MDPVKPSAVTPAKSKLARTFAKVLHLRAATGVAPVDGNHKVKPQQKVKEDRHGHVANVKVMTASHSLSQSFEKGEEVENNKVALEALLATLFASVSSIKAAYAQLQHAQSPYDPYGIQSADQLVVSELKSLSELKHSYLKKQFNPSPSPETAMVMAEIQELKSVLKTYEIMGKKLESQVRLKDSEIVFLREKLEEAINQNRLLEKRLNQSGQLSVLDNLHKSGLNPSHFMTVLRHTVKSIRIFVRLILDEMKVAKMDIDGIANAMEPCVVYWKDDHKCFAFESYVCKVMFSHFGYPNFSEPDDEHEKLDRELFFGQFMELKSVKPKEFLTLKPNSEFAKFCRNRYLKLITSKMESLIFGNLRQRNLLNAGEFPNTQFFASFTEMAKRIWLLHNLGFSFEHVSIFQVDKGSRYSEVYMECLADEVFLSSEPEVAFSTIPGFQIDRTIIQGQVYISPIANQDGK